VVAKGRGLMCRRCPLGVLRGIDLGEIHDVAATAAVCWSRTMATIACVICYGLQPNTLTCAWRLHVPRGLSAWWFCRSHQESNRTSLNEGHGGKKSQKDGGSIQISLAVAAAGHVTYKRVRANMCNRGFTTWWLTLADVAQVAAGEPERGGAMGSMA